MAPHGMGLLSGIQLFQLRLSPEQSGKVEYERERLLGITNKFIRLFRFSRGTTLIEIAVYMQGFQQLMQTSDNNYITCSINIIIC